MFSKNPNVAFYLKNDHFGDPYKMKDGDTIWWLDDMDRRGPWLFSFELKEIFNYWGDYPDHLTNEQKMMFDKDNPDLAFKRLSRPARGVFWMEKKHRTERTGISKFFRVCQSFFFYKGQKIEDDKTSHWAYPSDSLASSSFCSSSAKILLLRMR